MSSKRLSTFKRKRGTNKDSWLKRIVSFTRSECNRKDHRWRTLPTWPHRISANTVKDMLTTMKKRHLRNLIILRKIMMVDRHSSNLMINILKESNRKPSLPTIHWTTNFSSKNTWKPCKKKKETNKIKHSDNSNTVNGSKNRRKPREKEWSNKTLDKLLWNKSKKSMKERTGNNHLNTKTLQDITQSRTQLNITLITHTY